MNKMNTKLQSQGSVFKVKKGRKGMSTTNKIISAVCAVSLVIILLIVLLYKMGANNQERGMWNQLVAQQQNCLVVHDQMKRVIFDQFKISESASADFERIYPAIMNAQRGATGALLTFLSNNANVPTPEFVKLKERVMVTVENQRQTLTAEEKKLLELANEHDTYVDNDPERRVLNRTTHFPAKTVTSANTKQAFETGEDNDKNSDFQ
jgi:hypothetical protein